MLPKVALVVVIVNVNWLALLIVNESVVLEESDALSVATKVRV